MKPHLDKMPGDDAFRNRLRYHGDKTGRIGCKRDDKGARWYEYNSLMRYIESKKEEALDKADEERFD